MREGGRGAADHHGLAGLEHVGRHGVDLRAADGTDEGGDVGLPGQAAEGEHGAGVGGLVVLRDQLHLAAEHAVFVDLLQREHGAVELQVPGFRGGAGGGEDAANPQRLGRAGDAWGCEHGGGAKRQAAPGKCELGHPSSI